MRVAGWIITHPSYLAGWLPDRISQGGHFSWLELPMENPRRMACFEENRLLSCDATKLLSNSRESSELVLSTASAVRYNLSSACVLEFIERSFWCRHGSGKKNKTIKAARSCSDMYNTAHNAHIGAADGVWLGSPSTNSWRCFAVILKKQTMHRS